MASLKSLAPQDGRQSDTALFVARGTRRLLRRLNFSTISELPLLSGRRADIGTEARTGLLEAVDATADPADQAVQGGVRLQAGTDG